MKYISDSKAGRAISAYVVLDRKGKLVGKIQALHTESAVTVNVWDWSDATNNGEYFQTSKANGYGYDRFTAALAGLHVAGHTFADHCERSELTDRAMKAYQKEADAKSEGWDLPDFFAKWKSKGVSFENYSRESKRYTSAYLIGGLKGLESKGFQVIQAI